ncbi:M81 family metallopeptidase [Thioclava sp. 15-R06ZXC-3]|uniref:Microcystinase C n=1 Tax=Thioclava arctica TaxID=3238301 RepID=A0ABV3TQG4_9RHOB
MAYSVLSAEIVHETNTFSIVPTDLAAFRRHYLLTGAEAVSVRGDHNTELAGFLDVARADGWALTHVLSAAAGPGGRVTRAAFDELVNPLVAAARAAKHDGILLALHGAMVTDYCEDGEGEILSRLRKVVGRDVPIAVTLDPHANVTRAMCDLADIVVSFNTYPHIDMRETGRRVADILHRTMTGEIRPQTIRVACPMLEEVNGGRTDTGPMIARHAAARAREADPDVFAVSINGGFASADIAEVGPTVLVVGQGDQSGQTAFAQTIIDDIWAKRAEVQNDYMTPKDAARMAAHWSMADGPLIIADYADNPGAGAYGDSTALLAALLDAGVTGACFGPMVDGPATAILHRHNVGDEVSLAVGGKTAPEFGGGPLSLTGQLVWKGDGRVVGDGPMLNGLVRDFGPTAILHVGGIELLIVTHAHQMLDLNQFRTFGIDPAHKRVVALKSMQHFRAAFEPIAGQVIVCDSGAICTTHYERLSYKCVRRPIYPFDTL